MFISASVFSVAYNRVTEIGWINCGGIVGCGQHQFQDLFDTVDTCMCGVGYFVLTD